MTEKTVDASKILNCDGTKIRFIHRKKVTEIELSKLTPFPFPPIPSVVRCPKCRCVGKFDQPQGHAVKFKYEIDERGAGSRWVPIMICKNCPYWGPYTTVDSSGILSAMYIHHRDDDKCPLCRSGMTCPEIRVLKETIERVYADYPDTEFSTSPKMFNQDQHVDNGNFMEG